MKDQRPRLVIVGDIHGDARRLRRALNFVTHETEAHIVFTGDYIDRGPDSRAVLELLIGLREARSNGVTFLWGNHEAALVDYLDGGDLSNYAAYGGLATVRSYLTSVHTGALDEFKSSFPKSHRDFLESLECFYEKDGLLVSHAGFNPAAPEDRSSYAMYKGSFPELFTYDGPWPNQMTICGHYVQKSGKAYISDNLVCLDTGCGTLAAGLLTVLDYRSGQIHQF